MIYYYLSISKFKLKVVKKGNYFEFPFKAIALSLED